MTNKQTVRESEKLLFRIAHVGRKYANSPKIHDLFPFENYVNRKGNINISKLDRNDGLWTRREILVRYLLLCAVLDQGPDMEGVRLLVKDAVNALYKNEIRIFHKPLSFFKEISMSIDNIVRAHVSVKKIRSAIWARTNNTNPDKYNLFMDNSRQVLNYAIFRWGVPLAVPMLLEKDGSSLVNYIEKCDSGEIMSQMIKDDERYGLGKAIGDKAAHLFAKWYIHSFGIAKRQDSAWGDLSFELPMDSNAGRVLFRTGFFLNFVSLKELETWEVIQKDQGKSGTHYIRVTNLRGKKSNKAYYNPEIFRKYITICCKHLKTKVRPRTVEIQQIPNALLLNSGYGIGDLDDGLMYIGTNMCLNLEKPRCQKCPIHKLCKGFNRDRKLIRNYRT